MVNFIELPKNAKDIAGQRFYKLVAIGPTEHKKRRPINWLCRCDCGNEKIISGLSLRRGLTKSCGCFQRENNTKRLSKNISGKKFNMLTALENTGKKNNGGQYLWLFRCDCGETKKLSVTTVSKGYVKSCGCLNRDGTKKAQYKHGLSRTVEYRAWSSMIHRCTNPSNPWWKRYGGRGITVCDRWLHSVHNFIEDMGIKPSKGMSIERENNGKGYSPDNCKWATQLEQQNNKSTNHCIIVNGEEMTIAQAARQEGVSEILISQRIRRGWSEYEAIFGKVKH